MQQHEYIYNFVINEINEINNNDQKHNSRLSIKVESALSSSSMPWSSLWPSVRHLLGSVESRSEGVEEGGGHVDPEAVLSGAGEPAHVCPAGLTDDEVSPLQPVSALCRDQATLGVSPDHAMTALVSLNMTGQPGRVPGLEHDGAQPARDGGGGPLQGPGDAG